MDVRVCDGHKCIGRNRDSVNQVRTLKKRVTSPQQTNKQIGRREKKFSPSAYLFCRYYMMSDCTILHWHSLSSLIENRRNQDWEDEIFFFFSFPFFYWAKRDKERKKQAYWTLRKRAGRFRHWRWVKSLKRMIAPLPVRKRLPSLGFCKCWHISIIFPFLHCIAPFILFWFAYVFANRPHCRARRFRQIRHFILSYRPEFVAG